MFIIIRIFSQSARKVLTFYVFSDINQLDKRKFQFANRSSICKFSDDVFHGVDATQVLNSWGYHLGKII